MLDYLFEVACLEIHLEKMTESKNCQEARLSAVVSWLDVVRKLASWMDKEAGVALLNYAKAVR